MSLSRGYAANGLNQYATAGTASFSYDANGNLTGDGANTYTYDAENRLVANSGPVAATLSYDPLGRLWRMTTTTPARTIEWLHDGDAVVVEYNINPHRYVHGDGADDPLIWYVGTGLTDRRSVQADVQGSIVSIADASGAALAINSYDEYGIPGAGNSGRFLQTDPIGYADQVNLYAYVGNDPVNGRDPTGEFCTGLVDCAIKMVTVVVGGDMTVGGGAVASPAAAAVGIPAAAIGVVFLASHSYQNTVVKRPSPFIPRPPTTAKPVDNRSAEELVMGDRRRSGPIYWCSNPLCEAPHSGVTETTECHNCDARRKAGHPGPGKPRPLPPVPPPPKKPPKEED